MLDWKKMGLALVALMMLTEAGAQLMPERLSPSEQTAFWLREAAKAHNEGNTNDWVGATEKLHALKPFNPDFMTHLVQGYTRLDRISEAFGMMLKMQQQGLAQNWDSFEDLDPLREHSLYDHLNDLMIQAGQPFGRAKILATLPPSMVLAEAMAFDDQSNRLFVGTIRDGQIFVSGDGNDEWSLFADAQSVPDLMAVFGLAVDAKNQVLWVSTGMVSQYRFFTASSFGRTALIKLDLETGAHLGTYRVVPDGQPHLLSAIAVHSDGTVYATDALMPLVYRLTPESEYPTAFFGSGALGALRGLAIDEAKQKLYVADYELGIVVLDLSGDSRAWQLAIPETLNLGGIEGLYWVNDFLVAIQSGLSPNRVLRLALGTDGLGVVSVTPVVAALEVFDRPSYGTVDGGQLYLFANSHWAYVNADGRPIQRPLPEIQILQVDVGDRSLEAVGEAVQRQLGR